ncbi:hypothetical protein BH11ACT1_BH11ACT1_24350 [soil metagenome]
MTTWRWVFVGVGLAAFAATAVLLATHSASASQVANGFWTVVAVGALVQLVVSARKSNKQSQAAPPDGPGTDGVDVTAGPTGPVDGS